MIAVAVDVIEETANTGVDWLKWLPVILSACTLVFNVLFYMYFKDYIAFKYSRTADLAKIGSEFLAFLSEVVSFDDFEGVPTKIKNYSEQILLCFKIDEKNITNLLEEIFQAVQKRKTLNREDEIKQWSYSFRKKTEQLQKILRKYCGVIR